MDRNLTQIYANVWRLVAHNPSQMTGPGTNSYLVGDNDLIIIDPGPNQPAHLDNILAALQSLAARVQAVVITHSHSDHSGGAQKLARRLAVPLLSYGEQLQDRSEIEAGLATLKVYHTPGHIHAHICLLLQQQKLLFAGDLVAGEGTILIIPPDGDMSDYLNSLEAMKGLNPAAILPGHGPVIDHPQSLLQEYIDHRLMRERQVLHWLAQGYRSARQIAAQIYAGRPEVLGIATLQVEAHLTKLQKEGRL